MNQFPESARRRMQAGAAGDHPDADLLTAFAEHTLAGNEREHVLSHLAACAPCREVVSLAMPEQSAAEVVAPAAAASFRWSMLRWTAVAATVIVVGAAVSVLVPWRQAPSDVAVPIAESESAGRSPEPGSTPAPQPKATASLNDKVAAERPARALEAARAQKAGNLRKDEKLSDTTAASNKPAVAGGFAGKLTSNVVSQAAPPPASTSRDVLADGALAKTDSPRAETKKSKAEANEEFAIKTAPVLDAGAAKGAVVAGQSKVAAERDAGALQSIPAAPVPPPPPPPTEAAKQAITVHGALPAANEATGAPLKRQAPLGGVRGRAFDITPSRWRVSSTGAVERSADGQVWEKVEIDPAVTFRAMSSNGGELWAGGTGGALFHSTDAGRTWSRVKVGDEGMWVNDAITAVDFPSLQSGVVTTASGAVWITQNAGRTWQRRQ